MSALRLEALEDRALPSAGLFPNLVFPSPGAPDVGVASANGYTVTVINGGQAAPPGAGYAVPLQVLVEQNGHPVAGVPVSFDAPIWVTPPSWTISNPSGYFPGVPVFPWGPGPGLHVSVTGNATTDANGVATAPGFVANGVSGSYSVEVRAVGTGVGPVFIPITNAAFPGPLPPSVVQQLGLDLLIASSGNPQGAGDAFGGWFALSYLESPRQAVQLFWQEANLTFDLLLARGNVGQFEGNAPSWYLTYQVANNPLYATLPGYVMGLVECEALLASVQ
jgi:hypothetical protein